MKHRGSLSYVLKLLVLIMDQTSIFETLTLYSLKVSFFIVFPSTISVPNDQFSYGPSAKIYAFSHRRRHSCPHPFLGVVPSSFVEGQ
jgi:hypothetical protein